MPTAIEKKKTTPINLYLYWKKKKTLKEYGRRENVQFHLLRPKKSIQNSKIIKEHQLVWFSKSNNIGRRMKDRNHYMPPLKTMTCIVFVYFTPGILLPCDLAMICPEAQKGGFSYG